MYGGLCNRTADSAGSAGAAPLEVADGEATDTLIKRSCCGEEIRERRNGKERKRERGRGDRRVT